MGKSTEINCFYGHFPVRNLWVFRRASVAAEVTEFVGTQIDDIETYAIGCSLSLCNARRGPYIYIYIVYIYIYTHTLYCKSFGVYTYIYILTYVYISICVYVYISIYVQMYIYIYVWVYVYICIYIYIYLFKNKGLQERNAGMADVPLKVKTETDLKM